MTASAELIVQVALLHLAASLSPGPDIFLTLRNSLSGGSGDGVATSAGIVAGVSVQLVLCILGLSVVLDQSAWLRHWITVAGALYLIYLGLQSLADFLRTRPATAAPGSTDAPRAAPSRSFQSCFKQGLLTNLLNVKAYLYFIALFTYVIRPETPLHTRLGAAVTMVGLQFIAFSTIARFAGADAFRKRLGVVQRWAILFMGLVLLLFGAALLYTLL